RLTVHQPDPEPGRRVPGRCGEGAGGDDGREIGVVDRRRRAGELLDIRTADRPPDLVALALHDDSPAAGGDGEDVSPEVAGSAADVHPGESRPTHERGHPLLELRPAEAVGGGDAAAQSVAATTDRADP